MSKRKNFSPEIQEKTRSTATAARKIRGRILIVCEGKETEPNYFNSFPKWITSQWSPLAGRAAQVKW